MTASAIRGDREKCLEAGMNDYLAKPVRAQVLKSKLEEYLDQPAAPIVNLQQKADDMARSVLSTMGATSSSRTDGSVSNVHGSSEFVPKDLPRQPHTDQDKLSLPQHTGETPSMLRERTITPSDFKGQQNGDMASINKSPASTQ